MRVTSFVLAALCGAVGVGLIWALTGPGEPVAPPADTRPLAAAAGSEAVLERLDRIERAVEELTALQRSAARRMRAPGPAAVEGAEAAPTGPGLTGRGEAGEAGETTPSADAPPAPVIDDATLARTLERLEEKKIAGLTDAELRAEARRLNRTANDKAGARRMLERLLARDLEPETRAQALLDLGGLNRSLEDFDASERNLREAVRHAGSNHELATQASYNLVWTLKLAGRTAEALGEAERIARAPETPDGMRPWARWAVARTALDSGDSARAAADYRALLAEFEGDERYRQIVQDAKRELKALD